MPARTSAHDAPVGAFALEEDAGVLELRLAPCRIEDVWDRVRAVAPGLVEVDPWTGRAGRAARPGFEGTDASRWEGGTLLADPAGALGDGHLALAVSADHHATVWGRDVTVVAEVFGGWLGALGARALGADWPAVPTAAAASVLAPGEAWSQVRIERGAHTVQVVITRGGEPVARWVGRPGKAFRIGWEW